MFRTCLARDFGAGQDVRSALTAARVQTETWLPRNPDGIVVVPKSFCAVSPRLAQEMDFKEHSMYAYIEKLKSLKK